MKLQTFTFADAEHAARFASKLYSDFELTVGNRIVEQPTRKGPADVVVLATPMFNFSLPAVVKAWFDAVLLKGETWDAGESGYRGLLPGRKALVLMASGGRYEGPMAGWDHGMSLAKQLFQFMGFDDVRPAWASGVNVPNLGPVEKIVAAAQDEVRKAVRDWYGR